MMEQGKDGTRNQQVPHTLCCSFAFSFFCFYYSGGDSSSRREVKGKGDLQMPVNHPWGYIALANHLVLFPLHWWTKPLPWALPFEWKPLLLQLLLPTSLRLRLAFFAPHIRTVWSSLADASMWGFVGFQLTQLTVPEWPARVSMRSPVALCHM